jgi:hypothetical protein
MQSGKQANKDPGLQYRSAGSVVKADESIGVEIIRIVS